MEFGASSQRDTIGYPDSVAHRGNELASLVRGETVELIKSLGIVDTQPGF